MLPIHAILPIAVAALLIGVAVPAKAAQNSGEAASQNHSYNKNARKAKTCRRNPPPFMYNPRFMNRGFFNKKCPTTAKN